MPGAIAVGPPPAYRVAARLAARPRPVAVPSEVFPDGSTPLFTRR